LLLKLVIQKVSKLDRSMCNGDYAFNINRLL